LVSVLIGMGTWAYTCDAHRQVDDVARQLAQEGYDGLELDGGDTYFSPTNYPTSADRRGLVERFCDLGVTPCGYNPPFYDVPPTSSEPDIRRQFAERAKAAIDFAADCEMPTVRVDTAVAPPGPDDIPASDATNRLVEAWRLMAEHAASRGVSVVWEFEPGFMRNRPSEILNLIESVNHPSFTTLYDSCHAHMCAAVGARQEPPVETLPGGEIEMAERLRGRIGLIHLIDSDNSIHDEFTSTHAPFGRGVIDFDKLMGVLKTVEYENPWWTVDLCFWPDPERESTSSLRFIRDLMSRHDM
jgi:sugar phosphate isomerase/epimerase